MSEEMTSRERVVAALNHEEPDRVPIDFGATYNTSVNAIAYNRLKKHLGIESPTYSRYIASFLAAIDLDEGLAALERMGGDVLPVSNFRPCVSATSWKPYTLKDGSRIMAPEQFNPVENERGDLEIFADPGVPMYRMPKDGFYFDTVYRPLANIENQRQLEEVMPQVRASNMYPKLSEERGAILAAHAKRLHEQTSYSLLGDVWQLSMYHWSMELFGYEKFFMWMASDRDAVHYWNTQITSMYEEFLKQYLEAAGPYIDVILMGDDYGTQKGPQVSIPMFRELFKPYVTRVCSLIHEKCPHVKVLLHSCGSIAPLIPEFIECGIDALNPVQCTADNMNPAALKREFGRDIVFWGGGVSAQTTLFNGTVEDVRREVKERIDIFKPGGGYVFATDHDIQEHVPPDKIAAIFETAQRCRHY